MTQAEYAERIELARQIGNVVAEGPWYDVAELVVRKVLTARLCDGRPCGCGCVPLLIRQVQEHFERSCAAAIQASKPDICS